MLLFMLSSATYGEKERPLLQYPGRSDIEMQSIPSIHTKVSYTQNTNFSGQRETTINIGQDNTSSNTPSSFCKVAGTLITLTAIAIGGFLSYHYLKENQPQDPLIQSPSPFDNTTSTPFQTTNAFTTTALTTVLQTTIIPPAVSTTALQTTANPIPVTSTTGLQTTIMPPTAPTTALQTTIVPSTPASIATTPASTPVQNCQAYFDYLDQNATAANILGTTPCSVSSLSLDLTPFRAAALAPALYQLTKITIFSLSGTPGSEGIAYLAPAIRRMPLIQFSAYCGLNDDAAIVLATALNGQNAITYLDLRYNKIYSTGFQALSPAIKTMTVMQYLYLSGTSNDNTDNTIDDAAANALSDAIPSLQKLLYLYLDYTKITDNGATALATGLLKISTLYSLEMSHNQIGDAGLTALSPSFSKNPMAYLYLSYNAIGNSGIAAFATELRKSQLVYISLSNNNISNPGADALISALQDLSAAGSSRVSALYLTDNPLSTGKKAELKSKFPSIQFGV